VRARVRRHDLTPCGRHACRFSCADARAGACAALAGLALARAARWSGAQSPLGAPALRRRFSNFLCPFRRRARLRARAYPRHRRLHASDAAGARHLQNAAAHQRKPARQAETQAGRVVARARHLSQADSQSRRRGSEAMVGQPPLARPADRRRTAARHRGHGPHRLRQGGEGPFHRRAVRARLRRQRPIILLEGGARVGQARAHRLRPPSSSDRWRPPRAACIAWPASCSPA
jgi:hypothetical protein